MAGFVDMAHFRAGLCEIWHPVIILLLSLGGEATAPSGSDVS